MLISLPEQFLNKLYWRTVSWLPWVDLGVLRRKEVLIFVAVLPMGQVGGRADVCWDREGYRTTSVIWVFKALLVGLGFLDISHTR